VVLISAINAWKSFRRVAASSIDIGAPAAPEVVETIQEEEEGGEWGLETTRSGSGCVRDAGGACRSALGPGPVRGTTGDRHSKGWENLLPAWSSMVANADLSVSTPLGLRAGLVGVVGVEGEKLIGGEGVGVSPSLDASIAPPCMLMVDEARRSMGSLANCICLFLENENPAVHTIMIVKS
jgi:hypothetical protein